MPSRGTRWIGIAKAAALYLLLGLVTTVGIAWAIAAWVPMTRTRTWFSEERPSLAARDAMAAYYDYVDVECRIGFGAVRRQWQVASRGPGLISVSVLRLKQDAGMLEYMDPVFPPLAVAGQDSWGRLFECDGLSVEQAKGVGPGLETAVGFPALACWCGIRLNSSDPSVRAPWGSTGVATPGGLDAIGGLELPAHGGVENTATFRALPYRPIWSGLAVNTVFYAVLIFVVVSYVQGLRRLRRFHRGRCPRCGYDLAHDYAAGCPECAWGRVGACEAMQGAETVAE